MLYDIIYNSSFKEELQRVNKTLYKRALNKKYISNLKINMSNKILLLRNNPFMYQQLENYQYKGNLCRRMVIGNYSIIYYVFENESKIIILHIISNKSNFFNSKKFK